MHLSGLSYLQVPLKMKVEVISFSAHADFDQTSSFLDSLRCPHVVLVHGEAKEMMRLKDALERGATALKIERHVYTPKVLETLKVLVIRPKCVFKWVMMLFALCESLL